MDREEVNNLKKENYGGRILGRSCIQEFGHKQWGISVEASPSHFGVPIHVMLQSMG